MRLQCIASGGHNLPDVYLDPEGGYTRATKFELTKGKDYVVYALTIRRGGLWFYVLDESGVEHPIWHPAALFRLVDPRLSKYWTLGYSESGLSEIAIVFAIAEWARDPVDYYDRLSDGEEGALASFRRHRELMDIEFQ